MQGVVIWLDTLLCPVEPLKARNFALAQMERSYQEATHMMVLVASLKLFEKQSIY